MTRMPSLMAYLYALMFCIGCGGSNGPRTTTGGTVATAGTTSTGGVLAMAGWRPPAARAQADSSVRVGAGASPEYPAAGHRRIGVRDGREQQVLSGVARGLFHALPVRQLSQPDDCADSVDGCGVRDSP